MIVFLLVPEFADLSIEQGIVLIKEWAVKNKTTLNILKTKEKVFHRPHPSKYSFPDVFCDIERVVSVKLLGVFLTNSLSMTEHVHQTLKVCNQRLYLLCQLQK